jgi:hypothetical protein
VLLLKEMNLLDFKKCFLIYVDADMLFFSDPAGIYSLAIKNPNDPDILKRLCDEVKKG